MKKQKTQKTASCKKTPTASKAKSAKLASAKEVASQKPVAEATVQKTAVAEPNRKGNYLKIGTSVVWSPVQPAPKD